MTGATPPVTSNAARQARFRAKLKAQGMVTVTLIVPRGAVADLNELAEKLRSNPDLRPGPVRNVRTGKLGR